MIKIGEFSKIAQVSIKTLRYYDRLGLLKPAHIDHFNGYRYYDLTQLVTLNRILALKDLDFTLDQIKELLIVDLASHGLEKLLENKAVELQQRILDERARLLRVEGRLKQIQDPANLSHSPVVLKSSPRQLIASVRQTIPSWNKLAEWKQEQLNNIEHILKDTNLLISAPTILIYHQEAFRERHVDVEVGRFLKRNPQHIEIDKNNDILQISSLPAINHLATSVHIGDISSISETYASLAGWTQANGFRAIGPWRELTFPQEDPCETKVIEVQRPVMKAIKFYTQLEVNKMEPKIITKPGFTLVGLRYFGKNENLEISHHWERFNQRVRELGGLPNETGNAAIGLCITPEDESIDGAFEYVAGLPVTEAEDVPEDFVVRHVPEQTYAVFAHKGDLPSLQKTYEYIYETWLPQSNYKLAGKMDFEYYNADFKDFAPDSVFYIYVPVEKV